jgi:hypothetical protein
MKRNLKMLRKAGITLTILLLIGAFAFTAAVEAKAKVVDIKGMSYNVNASLEDNLNSLVGKKVYVTLDSGKTLAGFVKKVGNHLVHLEKLDGKDFFDAVIRINSIIAIEARFREFQR